MILPFSSFEANGKEREKRETSQVFSDNLYDEQNLKIYKWEWQLSIQEKKL